MMEWGDRSLKMGEDVLEALLEAPPGPADAAGPAYEMHKVMEPVWGRPITGLMADALDLAIERIRVAESKSDEIAMRVEKEILAAALERPPAEFTIVVNAIEKARRMRRIAEGSRQRAVDLDVKERAG